MGAQDKARDAVWEKIFSSLARFKEKEGHCRVPYHCKVGSSKIQLGIWVRSQRSSKDSMTAFRRTRLDGLGFVWDPISERWENGFLSLAAFKARCGHCRVPQRHLEGKFRLGAWVNQQRAKSNTLTAVRKRRLNEIGFVWDAFSKAWNKGFSALMAFNAREGHCDVAQRHVEGTFHLGRWVNQQRVNKGNLSNQRRSRLDAIGFSWRTRKGKAEKVLHFSRRISRSNHNFPSP